MLENPFFLSLLGNLFLAGIIISLVFLISLIRKRILSKVDKLVAFSVGLILGIIFLGFLPEIFSHGSLEGSVIGILILAGIFLFYVFELFLHWHHCKDLSEDGHAHHNHEHENSTLISVGTFFHNFIHGIILYSAFSIDIGFGIATTFALLSHAIPQNIANLLMTHKDTKYVYIAAIGGVIGVLAVYPFQEFLTHYSFHILAIITGGLLYTAMSDILPTFKKKDEVSQKLIYLLCMILGVFFFTLFQAGEHDHNPHEESHVEDTVHDNEDHEMTIIK